jgi:peptide/nickel transport system permease protein
MTRYLAGRLLQSVVVALGVSVIVFGALHLSGDPTVLMLPPDASRSEIDRYRHAYGFDDPFSVQYLRFLSRAVRGDFGSSLRHGQPAVPLLVERLPATLMLGGTALAWSILVGGWMGVQAAGRRGTGVDVLVRIIALLAQAIPVFWLGPMLILLVSVRFDLLPTSGYGTAAHLILPALTLGAYYLAVVARIVRSSVLEVQDQDFVRTARAKGLDPRRVMNRHVLRNSLIPVVSVMGLQTGSVLGGAVVTETIFAWPGLGRLAVQAIEGKDYPLVQAVVLFSTLLFVLVNLLTDLLYAMLDPQIRYA